MLDATTTLGTDTNGAEGWSVAWNTVGTPNGSHALSARAVNRAGLQTNAAAVSVTVGNTGGTTVVRDIPIVAGADDIEERTSDGRISANSTDLDFMLDNDTAQSAVGLRFTGLDVPRGASVTAAYVQFRADETHTGTTALTIQGLAADNLAPFRNSRFSLSTATRTNAAAGWPVASWTARSQTAAQRTPDLSLILQELVNRPGWSPGNALGLVLTGSGQRVAKATEGNAAPILHVEYRIT